MLMNVIIRLNLSVQNWKRQILPLHLSLHQRLSSECYSVACSRIHRRRL